MRLRARAGLSIRTWNLAVCVWLVLSGAVLANSTFTITANSSDRGWRSTASGLSVSAATARIGTETAGQTTAFVLPFQLPAVPVGQEIASATLSVYSIAQNFLDGITNLDLRGVRVSSNSTTESSDQTAGILLADNAYSLNATIPVGKTLTISTPQMTQYLRGIYTSDPQAGGKFVFFTLFPDAVHPIASRYLTVATSNNGTAAFRPVLTVVTRPIEETTKIEHHGVTWTILGRNHVTGNFVNGDPWIVGPITVVDISNSLNTPGFTPRLGQNGSMINPLVGHDSLQQGYDDGLTTYSASLNAGLRNGQRISAGNPLSVPAGSTLVSAVSWLYRTDIPWEQHSTVPGVDRELGIPEGNDAGLGTIPRPALRSAGFLTVLAAAPPANAFRPPYAGNDKTVRYTLDRIDRSKLLNLIPPSNTPTMQSIVPLFSRTWLDHARGWQGEFVRAQLQHPTPGGSSTTYGGNLAYTSGQVALMLLLDFSRLPGSPNKDTLLIPFLQYGIDCLGIANAGGGWPADGGHGPGRFWPILFAGVVFDDARMKSVGTWGRSRGEGFRAQDAAAGLVEFQEIQQHFYVSSAEVALTNDPTRWTPDDRNEVLAYTPNDIGTPEWGIRHAGRPAMNNAAWDTVYRDQNGAYAAAYALAARLMGVQGLWNHDPYFDYVDRWMTRTNGGVVSGGNSARPFVRSMWQTYAAGVGVNTFNNFQLGWFSRAEMANPSVTGATADPDGDGVNNLIEFFFGSNPRTPDDSAAFPSLELGAEGFRSVYRTRVRPPNGRVVWERSTDLKTWQRVTPQSERFTSVANGMFQVESTFPASQEPREFFRTRVIR